jgi:hypothetical protein
MTKQVKLASKMIEIQAKEWEKGNQHRVYFQMSEGGRNNMAVLDQLCWDKNKKEFVSCQRDFRNDKLYNNNQWQEFRAALVEAFQEIL